MHEKQMYRDYYSGVVRTLSIYSYRRRFMSWLGLVEEFKFLKWIIIYIASTLIHINEL